MRHKDILFFAFGQHLLLIHCLESVYKVFAIGISALTFLYAKEGILYIHIYIYMFFGCVRVCMKLISKSYGACGDCD